MVVARSCALTAVGTLLATWLDRQEQTVRQQGRAFCDAAEAKRGLQRQAVAVEPGVVPLLRWVLHHWPGTPLALARDAPPRGPRGTGLAVRVG
jgi:hypothetical protein